MEGRRVYLVHCYSIMWCGVVVRLSSRGVVFHLSGELGNNEKNVSSCGPVFTVHPTGLPVCKIITSIIFIVIIYIYLLRSFIFIILFLCMSRVR